MGAGAVAAEHLRGGPAVEFRQVSLGPAAVQTDVAEMVAEPVRVDTHPALPAAACDHLVDETRRRVKVIGRLPGETSCPTLVWAVLHRGWRGFTMTSDGLRLLQDLRRSLLEPPAQLRPRTSTSRPGDTAENVSAVA